MILNEKQFHKTLKQISVFRGNQLYDFPGRILIWINAFLVVYWRTII